MANRERDLELERRWRRRLSDWQQSGVTGREFCRQHVLSEASFYAWRREIARRDQQQHSAKRAAPAFVPVRVVGGEPVEVVVRSGQTVRVGAGFDAAHLRAVVAALEGSSC